MRWEHGRRSENVGDRRPLRLGRKALAAAGVGDDRLQRQARGVVVPDSFTHGASEQRMRGFSRGLERGDPGQCETFEAAQL
jgi:predicted metalloprotease